MIIHYLKIAVRNLLKYKLQSVISIVGLAIGIAFFIFSLYWLHYETSYDNFYPVSNRTYMIFLQEKGGSSGVCPSAMIPFLQEKCPEVETITRMDGNSGFDFAAEEKELKHPDFRMIDSLFLKCFPQKVIYGAAPTRDNEILLSESFARKYWKRPQDAIGSLLTQKTPPGFYIPNPLQLHVSGIMADAPTNSSFQYEGYCLATYENSDYHNKENWMYIGNTYVHLVLKEGVKLKDFSQRLHALLHEMEELKNVEFSIIPLYQKHFEFAAAESFSYSSIRMFTAASLLLLCCVLFNFINLFLNRYYQRLREMKLRKSLGANQRSLIGQLLTEEDKKTQIATLEISKGGEAMFNFRLMEGRMFTEEDWTANSDSPKDAVTGKPALNKVLITQKMADLMRTNDPIGKIIRIPTILFQGGPKTYYTDYEVIGVVKEIHPQGMRSESYPTVIMQSFRFMQALNYFKVVPGMEKQALHAMNALVEKHQWEYYGYFAEPQTLDSKLEEMSKSENATYHLFSVLSALCILISLFGIFSISSSTIRQRRKEIAVRKIMGAAPLAGAICLPHIHRDGCIHRLVGSGCDAGAAHHIAAGDSGGKAESGRSDKKRITE